MAACLAFAACAGEAQERVPSFAELEAAGARIGEIRILPQDIFDLEDPRENKWLFRLANKLHINTRPKVIERTLLFKSGDPVSVRVLEESERLLRTNRYLYEVSIVPIAAHDGVVDVEVRTRDTWSLEPGFSVRREGGENTTKMSIEEDNLLGTGISLGLGYQSDVDRKTTDFQISNKNILGTRLQGGIGIKKHDDGDGQSFSLSQPFYALDTRWSAGIQGARNEQFEPVYNAGENVGEYRHLHQSVEGFGGWSTGLRNGWVQRYSLGFTHQDDSYGIAEGHVIPPQIPADLVLTGPFLRAEIIEDAFRKETNVNLIGRVEDVPMGFSTSLRLGRGLTRFGSSRNTWFYDASIANGFDVRKDAILLTSVNASGRYAERGENAMLSSSARYFQRHGPKVAYYASGTYSVVNNPDTPNALQLGGDSGLRGYPLRYQSGERQALFTLEARYYTDWYPFRLFRVGGAVFYDVGRAWGGENTNMDNPGWLSDVGIGLRFLNARTAFGSVLHADIAFPLNREGDIKSVQFVVRTKVAL